MPFLEKANYFLNKSAAENPFPQELITNKELVMSQFSKMHEYFELLRAFKNVP